MRRGHITIVALGLVGEAGRGKTTVTHSRSLMRDEKTSIKKYYLLQSLAEWPMLGVRRSGMAEIERLSIALPTPMADAVRRAVESGEYASTSEVIREALRLWESRRQLRERDLEVLRRRWDEGKASGRAGRLDIKRVVSEERAKLRGAGKRRG
jgi:antitoxin ParD1/3/4